MQENKFLSPRIITTAIIVVAVISFSVWGVINKKSTTSTITEGTQVNVVASFYPLYYFASQIGGDMANVINITPSGAEPHDYEPSTQDIVNMTNSKLLLLNGGGLEAWGDKVEQIIDTQKTLVMSVGTDVMTQTMEKEGSMRTDPHVWLSPVLATIIANKIYNGFVQVDSVNEEYFRTNKDALIAKLVDLDNEYKQGLASCAKKDIVTSHSAFGYLASAYGLSQVAIAGLSPEAEPSPRQLAEIVDLAKKNNIKYIFFESLTSPKLSETIASEVGAQTLVLNPIEGLTPDEIAAGGDYLSAMRENLKNLQLALECTN